MLRQIWTEKPFQAVFPAVPAEPFRSGVGVLLVGIAASTREAVVPQRGINLDDNRFVRRHLPAIERPEVRPISDLVGALLVVGQIFQQAGASHRHVLIVLSDMWQETYELKCSVETVHGGDNKLSGIR
jgi:hypothetical protein